MKTTSFENLRRRLLKNKEFKKSYDELEPEFALIRAIIRKRLSKGLTQKQLAAKLGTKQPVISRLEGGNYNPSIKFLNRVAHALNSELHITIQ